MTEPTDGFRFEALRAVTHTVARYQETVSFAGFLTREDSEAVYIADEQGTWVIRREDLAFLEDWTQAKTSAPEYMLASGRPVRVGIKDGATIQEVRPWRIRRHLSSPGHSELSEAVQNVFTLGGAPLPIGEQTIKGEHQIVELERLFVRRMGWPDLNDSRALRGARPRVVSMTQVLYDGY
jgi:hypothetical protein